MEKVSPHLQALTVCKYSEGNGMKDGMMMRIGQYGQLASIPTPSAYVCHHTYFLHSSSPQSPSNLLVGRPSWPPHSRSPHSRPLCWRVSGPRPLATGRWSYGVSMDRRHAEGGACSVWQLAHPSSSDGGGGSDAGGASPRAARVLPRPHLLLGHRARPTQLPVRSSRRWR